MKTKLLFLVALALSIAACKDEKHTVIRNGHAMEVDGPMPEPIKPANEKRAVPADGKYPEMTFTETEFDFGDMKQHDKATHYFTFENTGEADLLISHAQGSCGCTVPEYPKEAIKPGGKSKIKVTFDSGAKKGMQHKTVTLVTNTEAGKEHLQIKANINVGVK